MGIHRAMNQSELKANISDQHQVWKNVSKQVMIEKVAQSLLANHRVQ